MSAARFWQPKERATRKLRVRFDWLASESALAMIHKRFGNYLWPLVAANDADHVRW